MRSESPGGTRWLKGAAWAVIAFLHVPLALIILYAFSAEDKSYVFPPPALTTRWFGVAWQREELPSEPDIGEHWAAYGDPGLGVIDGTAYLVLPESGQVWVRQPDGGQWAQPDTSTIGDAMLGGGWSTRRAASDPVKVDDLIYFEITEDYTLPRKQLGLPANEPTTWLTRLDEDRFELCSSTCDGGDERFKRTLRVDETDTGLRVVDDRTGEVLASAGSPAYSGQDGAPGFVDMTRGLRSPGSRRGGRSRLAP